MQTNKTLPDPRLRMKAYFEAQPFPVYTEQELKEIFAKNHKAWYIHRHTNEKFMLDFLLDSGLMYKPSVHRDIYVKNGCTILSVAWGLYKDSYVSHGSALYLHGLIDKKPDITYSSLAKSKVPTLELLKERKNELQQETVDKAFRSAHRSNPEIMHFKEGTIHFIKSRQMQHGDEADLIFEGEPILLTGIERTLIDVTIRPGYAGGSLMVLEAYKNALHRTDLPLLTAKLKQQNLIYPYHQAMGFYLHRAGLPLSELKPWLPTKNALNFYLDYQITNPVLDPTWKIYYPPGL